MVTLLTIPEVAERLRVSSSTVRGFVKTGDLPVVRLGRLIRVDETDLRRFVRRHVDPPDPQANGQHMDEEDDYEDVQREAEQLANWRPLTRDDALWNIVGMASSLVEDAPEDETEWQPLAPDSPLMSIIGSAPAQDDDPTDVAEHHDKYLAEAYADLHEDA